MTNAIAAIKLDYDLRNCDFKNIEELEDKFEIISSEDMDLYLEEREEKNEKGKEE